MNNNRVKMSRERPEQQGVSSAAILRFLEAVEAAGQELHSFMLLRNGSVLAEGWWSPHAPEIPHMMFSLSKSFTSTAVGMAVSEGYFTVDDKVISFFPDERPSEANDYLDALRIKHLLYMATGHDGKPFNAMIEAPHGSWAKGFFEAPLLHEPGSYFLYNTGASYMLSEIVQRSTGMNLMEYLTPRLFEPLGITGASWMQAPNGVSLGGIGLMLKTEDIARFGQLYLQKGLWQGQQVLSKAWIEEATAKQVSNGDNPNNDWTQGYGYQLWRCQHGFYRGDGAFGQFCIVMERCNAILAITAAVNNMQAVMNAVWEYLVPAFAESALAEDKALYEKLQEKLANLAIAPVEGRKSSKTAERVSGKTYHLEANELGIESLSLDFDDMAAILRLKTKRGEEIIIAPFGSWRKGQASIFNEIWLSGSQPLVASGAWLDESCYLMHLRLYESPYVYSLSFQFEGDSVSIPMRINLSLEPKAPVTLRAVQQ